MAVHPTFLYNSFTENFASYNGTEIVTGLRSSEYTRLRHPTRVREGNYDMNVRVPKWKT